jgi:hypothetical protein
LGSCIATLALLGCQFRVGGVKPPDRLPSTDLAAPVDLARVRSHDLSMLGDLAAPPDLLPVTGQLMVTGPDPIPGSVDLTQEGYVDWAHCGYLSVAGLDDRRANGPAAITIGATGGTINAFAPYTPTFSWSDGTPNASATTQSGIYVTGAGHALTVSVLASRTPLTLRIYLDVFNATAQLTAHLSDSSAPDYVGSMITGNDPGTYGRYTILFHAASSAQTLTVTWTMTNDQGGSIDLLAATLY